VAGFALSNDFSAQHGGTMLNRRRLLLAGVAALPGIAFAKPSEARKRKSHPKPKPKWRWKTVSRTFTSSQLIAIPTSGPANLYPTTIKVQGLTRGRIQQVAVTLTNFTHAYPSELDMILAAPNGHATFLMSDAGGEWPSVVPPISTLTFDDAASGNIPTPLMGGTFQPTNLSAGTADVFPSPAPTGVTGASLAEFKGGNPNGTWSLFILDDTSLDGGAIGGWSLKITARIKVRVKPKPKNHRQSKGGGRRQVKKARKAS
jgi:subtilisin-like proprotein convertase family protein